MPLPFAAAAVLMLSDVVVILEWLLLPLLMLLWSLTIAAGVDHSLGHYFSCLFDMVPTSNLQVSLRTLTGPRSRLEESLAERVGMFTLIHRSGSLVCFCSCRTVYDFLSSLSKALCGALHGGARFSLIFY